MKPDSDALDDFYAALKEGLAVDDFLRRRKQIFQFVKSIGLIDDYVLGRRRMAKLRDEVTPAARFVRGHARPDDEIQFALDGTYPDCVVRNRHGCKREIEVTVARAQERLALMERAIKGGEVRGIINVQDHEELVVFRRPAEHAGDPDKVGAYSTEQLFSLIVDAVETRAKRKARHKGDTLLIEILPDMYALTDDRVRDLEALLLQSEEVKRLSFSDVYVLGYGHQGDICMKIK
ncbi:hypothetical protein [Sinorhizobium alkalisoli]|uniref:hypothetical protein n=1 Tax=Sinorhizobium alkalisoli TaxID=1752398 RepID=UPI00124DCF0E|nr:hypothetical protein [Sinorhizobium alkalisoli]